MVIDDGKLTGDMLAFYLNGKALACEISCDLSFNKEFKQISPTSPGGWVYQVPGVKSWQMTTAANFITHFRDADFKTIMQAWINGDPFQVAMRTSDGYSPAFFIGGQAYPASGTLSSSGFEMVGYSSVFVGNGPLVMTTEASEGDFWRILNANPATADKPFYFQSTL